MFSKFFSKKSNRKDLIFLMIQVHLLIIILIGVLWSIFRLNQETPSFFKLFFSSEISRQNTLEKSTPRGGLPTHQRSSFEKK